MTLPLTGTDPPRGIMFVVSSPSGTGKTTLCRQLVAQTGAELSVSATTRPPRPGEQEGRDYRYLAADAFDRLVAEGEFLEWAVIHGHRYGTPRAPIEARLRAGGDIVFDVDWQGAAALKKAMPDDVTSVFLLPPSLPELRARLQRRPGTDAGEADRRMAGARSDIERWQQYDHVLINDRIDHTLADLLAIHRVAQCVRRHARIATLVEAFLQSL